MAARFARSFPRRIFLALHGVVVILLPSNLAAAAAARKRENFKIRHSGGIQRQFEACDISVTSRHKARITNYILFIGLLRKATLSYNDE